MERETKREKKKKKINFSNYSRSFAPQMLAVYARAVKLIAFFCPMVTNWLLNMRTRQNIKLQLKIRLNLSLTVTTLNSPVPSRHHGFFLCLLFR